MEPCEESRNRIFLYLDDELRGAERAALESHAHACEACRQALAEERSFLDQVRARSATYRAPKELRLRVEGIVRHAPVCVAPSHLRSRIRRTIDQALPRAAGG